MVKCILLQQSRGKSGSDITTILKKLEINTQPTQLNYKKSERFNIDGLTATIYYGISGSPVTLKATKKIPNDIPYNILSINPNGPLDISTKEVIISYTENDTTAKASISITVESASYSSRVDHAITDKSRTAGATLTDSYIGKGTIGTAVIG